MQRPLPPFPARLLACATLATTTLAHAQSVPDAGSVLKQIEQQRQTVLPQKSAPEFVAPTPMESLGGATVTVTAFRFAGNSLLTNDQLQAVVAGLVNKPLTFSDLQNAAIAVANTYRNDGWVVRAYLPKQDITSGVVTIQVVEGVFGSLRMDGTAQRVPAEMLTSIVEAAQKPGAPVNGDSLDRALLLINDTPGVHATARLAEGANPGATDLVLDVGDTEFATGSAILDNTGSRSTGAVRETVMATLNSPLKIGDQAQATLLHTQGSDYVRLDYTLPVGDRGWRVGANASYLNYKVVAPEFEQLDAHGTSETAGLEASYPIIRTRLMNLYFSSGLDRKHFDNLSAGAVTTHYDIDTARLSLNGNLFDNFHGGGANSASLSLVQGRVDLSSSPNRAADAQTTRSAGSFTKLDYAIARQQAITDSLSAYGSLSGQFAQKNLDSSEKFYLGGSTGVRAYPTSEGGGSEGQLLSLELRSRLPAGFNGTAFYDYGSVRVNVKNSFTGAASPNSYSLQGLGLALGWTANFGLALNATWSHRLGDNPNPTATGRDQDGSLDENRFWLQAAMPF